MCRSEEAVQSALGESVDDCDDPSTGCTGNTDFTVAFVTPGVDPVNSPNSTNGHNDQNEYTFSTATPGVLTMTLRAVVTPAGKVGEAKPRVSFEVDGIGASTLTWDGAGDGSATTIAGDKLESVATFTGLPASNADFGSKTAKLKLDGAVVETRTFEVFFPRDATNHPNPGQGTTPNWFFYWEQLAGVASLQYGGAGTGDLGEVRGMTRWSYKTAPDKPNTYVFDPALTNSPVSGYYGPNYSGIDSVIVTAVHEGVHVQQITRADALVPTGQGCWRYGYSWNQHPVMNGQPHNHWGTGPDGKYGPSPGVDAGAVAVQPPFVAGQGDDVNIDSATHHWPTAFGAAPTPSVTGVTGVHPIEVEAENHAISTVTADHQFARQDWGDPGKNHATVDRWDD